MAVAILKVQWTMHGSHLATNLLCWRFCECAVRTEVHSIDLVDTHGLY